jgi:hypothetical protein
LNEPAEDEATDHVQQDNCCRVVHWKRFNLGRLTQNRKETQQQTDVPDDHASLHACAAIGWGVSSISHLLESPYEFYRNLSARVHLLGCTEFPFCCGVPESCKVPQEGLTRRVEMITS